MTARLAGGRAGGPVIGQAGALISQGHPWKTPIFLLDNICPAAGALAAAEEPFQSKGLKNAVSRILSLMPTGTGSSGALSPGQEATQGDFPQPLFTQFYSITLRSWLSRGLSPGRTETCWQSWGKCVSCQRPGQPVADLWLSPVLLGFGGISLASRKNKRDLAGM